MPLHFEMKKVSWIKFICFINKSKLAYKLIIVKNV